MKTEAPKWRSTLEGHPEYVHAVGMISIEHANMEMALADPAGGDSPH
jgi:hypothetical protein